MSLDGLFSLVCCLGLRSIYPEATWRVRPLEGLCCVCSCALALLQVAGGTDLSLPLGGSETPGGCVWLLFCRQARKDRQCHFLQGMVVVKAFIMNLRGPISPSFSFHFFPQMLLPRSLFSLKICTCLCRSSQSCNHLAVSLVAHKSLTLRMVDGSWVLLKVVFSLLLF